ncbi:extracellular solute-binding protein [Microbacterium panaciterrae]|uniref:Sugar ABC transporter substrate-binding protein n=1 Tax=Microbacterium panaciterrae TaxID=985759 RepID=A0ABP8PS18_9MICO
MSMHHRKLGKFGAAVGLIVAGAIALAGCSSGGSTGGVTTVTVMYQANEFTPDMVKAFEKDNPDIKINLIEPDDARLNAMVTAGDPPDLVRSGPSANLFARGLALPLDDYIAKSTVIKEADLVAANDAWKWDGTTRGKGKRYGLLKDWSPDVSFWQNTQILKDAGIEPFSTTEPTTWDQLLTVAKQLKAAGVENAVGLEWQWGLGGLLGAMVNQGGETLYNKDLTEINLENPVAYRSLQWLADYASSGAGVTSENPLADGWDLPSFQTGKMALSLDGYWLGGNLAGDDAASVRDHVQLIPAPTWEVGGKRYNPVVGGIGGYIPVGSKHPDQAWRVMEYFFGGAPAEERSKSGWGLPALQSLWGNLPTALPFQASAVDTVNSELKYIAIGEDSPYLTGTVLTDALNSEIIALSKGQISVEDAAKKIQDQVNVVLKETKDQLG